jgi:hypothetical protein
MISLAIPIFTNLAEPTACVSEPPYFVRRPAPVRMAVVGNDVLLECETGGDPVPRTRWTRQGAPDIDQTRAKVCPHFINFFFETKLSHLGAIKKMLMFGHI